MAWEIHRLNKQVVNTEQISVSLFFSVVNLFRYHMKFNKRYLPFWLSSKDLYSKVLKVQNEVVIHIFVILILGPVILNLNSIFKEIQIFVMAWG